MTKRLWLFMAIVGFVGMLVAMIFMAQIFGDKESKRDRAWNYVKDYAEKVNDRNYDIMYYGSEMGLPVNFKARRIFNFEDFSIESEDAPEGHVGHLLILFDPYDEYFLSDDQVAVISDLYETHGFRIIAIGDGKIRMLENGGLLEQGTAEKYDSVMFWKKSDKGRSTAPGIADGNELVPYEVEQEIDKKYVPAYQLLIELGSKDLYWN